MRLRRKVCHCLAYSDRDPVATLVCLHPLPTHGGMMDSHLYRKAAWRLPALADMAVLRLEMPVSVESSQIGPRSSRRGAGS